MTEYIYPSPIAPIYLLADGEGLRIAAFEGQSGYPDSVENIPVNNDNPHIASAVKWFDCYFSGEVPDFTPELKLTGSDFQQAVWELLLAVPYGKTVTYGELARTVAEKRGVAKMSAQAVGNAVGRNPVAVIVPCHRVLCKGGKLTGYNGGIDKKAALLKIEKLL